jgi:hypothetical protein
MITSVFPPAPPLQGLAASPPTPPRCLELTRRCRLELPHQLPRPPGIPPCGRLLHQPPSTNQAIAAHARRWTRMAKSRWTWHKSSGPSSSTHLVVHDGSCMRMALRSGWPQRAPVSSGWTLPVLPPPQQPVGGRAPSCCASALAKLKLRPPSSPSAPTELKLHPSMSPPQPTKLELHLQSRPPVELHLQSAPPVELHPPSSPPEHRSDVAVVSWREQRGDGLDLPPPRE